MNIIDSIQADQIEDGDQILLDGEPLTDVRTRETDDPDEVIVRGYSLDEGEMVEYAVPFDYSVDVWAV